jgi:hypothetical protein
VDADCASLNIERFHNICPDKNGKLSTFDHTRFSCTKSARHCGVHEIRDIHAYHSKRHDAQVPEGQSEG